MQVLKVLLGGTEGNTIVCRDVAISRDNISGSTLLCVGEYSVLASLNSFDRGITKFDSNVSVTRPPTIEQLVVRK